MRAFVKTAVVLALSGPIIPTGASAYVGTYYADFGRESWDVACQRILDAFKGFTPIASYPGRCLFVEKDKFFTVLPPEDTIILQFKKISRAAYEMVYDLPNRSGDYYKDQFSRYLALDGGNERLARAGVTWDPNTPAIAAAKRQQEEEVQDAYRKIAPPCKEVTFTGLAVADPAYFPQYTEARDKKDILARNPIACTEAVSGESIYGGAGLYNPTYRRQCRGLAAFQEHKATVLSWDQRFYRVAINIETTAGQRAIPLWIRRQDARCAGR